MEKVRYEVDPHNRLVVKKASRGRGLPRFRNVLDGKFKLDGYNNITYHAKSPSPGPGDATGQIKLRGNWRLSSDHELVFTLDAWHRGAKADELTLRGDIIDVNSNSIIFAMTTKSESGSQSTYSMELKGSWQADPRNRLVFKVARQRGESDSLVFDGAWDVDGHNQIIYRYERTQLKTKLKRVHIMVFRGYWDINSRSRLTYTMDASTECAFNFSAGVGEFSANTIQYEVGVGLSYRVRPVRRAVTLRGVWRATKDARLSFEIAYESGQTRTIAFMAQADIKDRNTVIFKLRKESGRQMIGELELSHKLLGPDGEIFLRLLRSKEESGICAGAGLRW